MTNPTFDGNDILNYANWDYKVIDTVGDIATVVGVHGLSSAKTTHFQYDLSAIPKKTAQRIEEGTLPSAFQYQLLKSSGKKLFKSDLELNMFIFAAEYQTVSSMDVKANCKNIVAFNRMEHVSLLDSVTVIGLPEDLVFYITAVDIEQHIVDVVLSPTIMETQCTKFRLPIQRVKKV